MSQWSLNNDVAPAGSDLSVSFETIRSIWDTDGLSGLLAFGVPFLYNAVVRSRLPTRPGRTVVQYGPVDVYDRRRWLDGVVPFAGDRPAYERSLVRGIRDAVDAGDSVVVVGGGYGVSTVVCARQATDDGSVAVFEGAASWASRVRETAALNGVDDVVSVTHAVVSEPVNLHGSRGEAAIRSAVDLPHCDVLVLDCEGAELDILSSVERLPDRVVVETHGGLGAPTERIGRVLRDLGYEITERMPAHDTPVSSDQFVLVARADRTGTTQGTAPESASASDPDSVATDR